MFWALISLTSVPHVASLYTNGGACPLSFEPTSLYLRDIRTADAAHPCGDCNIDGSTGQCTLGTVGAYSCTSNQYLSWNYEVCYPGVTICPSNSSRVTTADMWVTDGRIHWLSAYFGCACNAGYYYNSSTKQCTETQPINTRASAAKASSGSIAALVVVGLSMLSWLACEIHVRSVIVVY